jgi:hypothetical protein
MRYSAFYLLLFAFSCLHAQQKFNSDLLNDPVAFEKKLSTLFSLTETEKITPVAAKNHLFFENGLRKNHYKNLVKWHEIKDSVEVKEVNIIFSKYPLVEGHYDMYVPLLCARIQNLLQTDPYLNDTAVAWKITLQTACSTEQEAKKLFHGAKITYQPISEILVADKKNTFDFEGKMQITAEQFNDKLDFMLKTTDIELTEKENLRKKTWEDRSKYLVEFYENKLFKEKNFDVEIEIDTGKLKETREYLDQFIYFYGNKNDSSITHIFTRNNTWHDALVVVDWTGSMYQYGAQALQWHINNHKISGLKYFTLFNDGDQKKPEDKKIGFTGGIYHKHANQVSDLINLYNYVMLKGGGGEPEENDIEAIIAGIKKFPQHQHVILIADNHSCIRDIKLVDSISKPVHVIVCGYDPRIGINPQYIKLADETGGSVHTIEEDIEKLKSEKQRYGISLEKNFRSKIAAFSCAKGYRIKTVKYYVEKVYQDIDSALLDKTSKKTLDLSNKHEKRFPRNLNKIKLLVSLKIDSNQLKKLPKHISNLKNLVELDASYNTLKKVHKDIYCLRSLQKMDLSNNQLQKLPDEIFKMRYLKWLNLNNNQITRLPKYLTIRKLEYFYINNNMLVEIPYGIGYLRKTKILDMSNNRIEIVPRTIGSMKKVEVIDLSNNNISSLPKKINKLKNLRILKLNGNPLSLEEKNRIQKLLPKTQIEF